MGSSDLPTNDGYEADDSDMAIKISSEVMVAAVVFFFLVVVFVFFLYLYAKHHIGRSSTGRRRAQLVFAAGDSRISSRGLDAVALCSLPITVYKRSDFKEVLECSVCLCELSDGEKARLLPKCNHAFHLECIDMWFQSHSTCPVCRCPAGPDSTAAAVVSESAADGEPSTDSPVMPTNMLFWGNREGVNTGSFSQEVNIHSSAHFHRTLVISVPSRRAEGFPSPMSPLPSSRLPIENMKSTAEEARSPGSSRFRSLRKLLSMGKRTGGSNCSSPIGEDIEQGFAVHGEGSSSVAKTPTTSS